MSKLDPRGLTLLVMVFGAALTRLTPHPPNFTAIGAMCLFGGALFYRRWVALAVPLVALLLSDLVLSYAVYDGLASITSFKYFLFAATVGLGMLLRGRVTAVRVTGTAVAATVLFFLLSNFHVWLVGDLYPKTAAGLWTCYLAAVPFAQNMLWANLFYTAVLFGGWKLLAMRWPQLELARSQILPVREAAGRW